MSKRKELINELFDEGLRQIKRLELVKYLNEDDFFERIYCNTGTTKGARGGVDSKGNPCIYIGTRLLGFDKENDFRYLTGSTRHKDIWKTAAALAKRGQWLHVEYSHIHSDPEIGGFISDEPTDHIRTTIAHELAHAIHWWTTENTAEKDTTSHGKLWQDIYRTLRVEWVNPLLTKI